MALSRHADARRVGSAVKRGGRGTSPCLRPPKRIIEQVCDESGWWGTRIEYTPARPVWLDLARVLPPRRVRHDDVPLRVRAAGIDLGRVLHAWLHAWQQTNTGDWVAEVETVLVNRTERGQHVAWLFAPAEAVQPRTATDS